MLPSSLCFCLPPLPKFPSSPSTTDAYEFLAVVWAFSSILSLLTSSLPPLLVDHDLSRPIFPLALSQSLYCLGVLCQSGFSRQFLSLLGAFFVAHMVFGESKP
ncbi:hypothetical protein ACB092_08G042600 [Castanea dentata]